MHPRRLRQSIPDFLKSLEAVGKNPRKGGPDMHPEVKRDAMHAFGKSLHQPTNVPGNNLYNVSLTGSETPGSIDRKLGIVERLRRKLGL